MNTAAWARVLLFVVPGLWSSNYLIARLSAGAIAPHALALGRWTLALLILLPWVWRELARNRQALRQEWLHLLVLGGTGMWICGAFVYQAGHSTTAGNIALIYATSPVMVTLVSTRMLGERMTRLQGLAVGMALLGVLWVITQGDPGRLRQVQFTAGDGWISLAAVSWVADSVLLKHWPSRLSPLARLVAIILGGLVWLLPGTLIEMALVQVPEIGPRGWTLIVLGALLPGVLSYGAFSYLQRELGAARTALMLYVVPIYSAFGAWIVLGEQPGWHHVVGALLILPSIWLATRR